MNIHIMLNLGYSPFQLYHRQEMQNNILGYLQLSGQTSNFVQYGSKMWEEVGLCKRWLD